MAERVPIQRRKTRYWAVATMFLVGLLAAAWSAPSGGSRLAAGAEGSEWQGQRAATGFGSDWTVYHGNALSTGLDSAGTRLSPLHKAWVSPTLDGQLYGEPLVYAGRVYIATENDSIYALSAHSGEVLWHHHYAAAVPAGALPCGDIGPKVGITGTPVIDKARHELFAVADEMSGSAIHHRLLGVNVYTGKIELNQAVDPIGQDAAAQLQRAGLTLDAGRVIIGYGGNYGDCGEYHGWIVGVPVTGGKMLTYEVDPAKGEREGAVWMGGGSPLVDPKGNIWFSTGNGSVTSSSGPYDRSDSVTELTSSLKLEQSFAPSDWYSDNASDADLGSAAPALVDGYVFQVGKSHIAYLLKESHLGGIGHSLSHMPFCSGDPHGGLAVEGSTVYVGCGDGVWAVTIHTTAPHMTFKWTTGSGANGPPIISSGLIWSIDGNGTLWGLSPATGKPVVSESTNGEANHFPTPAVADGLMLVPSTDQVFAFDGPAGLPPAP